MKTRSPQERSEGNPFRSNKPSGVLRGGKAKDDNDTSSDKKKRVNVGIEGETPKKVFSIDRNYPSKAFDAMAHIMESSVDDESDEVTDQSSQPDSEAQDAEDDDNEENNEQSAAEFLRQLATENNSFERPKTSRGKSHPSPDEFFNYVVPSPEANRRGGRSRLVLEKDDASQSQVDDAVSTTSSKRHIKWNDSTPTTEPLESDTNDMSNIDDNEEDERHELSDNYLLGINLDGVSRDKQIALLGCWLFGSALRI